MKIQVMVFWIVSYHVTIFWCYNFILLQWRFVLFGHLQVFPVSELYNCCTTHFGSLTLLMDSFSETSHFLFKNLYKWKWEFKKSIFNKVKIKHEVYICVWHPQGFINSFIRCSLLLFSSRNYFGVKTTYCLLLPFFWGSVCLISCGTVVMYVCM